MGDSCDCMLVCVRRGEYSHVNHQFGACLHNVNKKKKPLQSTNQRSNFRVSLIPRREDDVIICLTEIITSNVCRERSRDVTSVHRVSPLKFTRTPHVEFGEYNKYKEKVWLAIPLYTRARVLIYCISWVSKRPVTIWIFEWLFSIKAIAYYDTVQ